MLKIMLKLDETVLKELSLNSAAEWTQAQVYLEGFLAGYFALKGAAPTRGGSASMPMPALRLDGLASSSPSVDPKVGIEEFVLIDISATGKRNVATLGKQRVTGNMLAGLQVILELGVPVTSPAQLLAGLRKHERFDIDVTTSSARNQIRTLKIAKLLTDDGQLTEAGKYVASEVGPIPRPQLDIDEEYPPEEDLPF